MIKNRILKLMAVSMAFNFLLSALAPSIVYALTSGPTTPEYSSFEPIDTTDLVDLTTGDFTYNIPLLEVPGPEGGYPLALSYHAGISPEEEASWVGLGWTLNPGAINRTVNGYADDVNGSTEVVHDTWSGGETNSISIGIGIGLTNTASAGFGITIANDTYRGVGVGVNANIGFKLWKQENSSGSLGLSIDTNPYGQSQSISAGFSITEPGSGTKASIGLTLMSTSEGSKLGAYAGVGINTDVTSLSASISTSSSKPSYGISAVSISATSNNSQNIFSTSGSFSIDIPLFYHGLSLSLGKSHVRYYLDQSDATHIYGSLYGKNISGDLSNISYDCFSFKSMGANFYTDTDKDGGGSMPAYDSYAVMGQGIGGAIRPYNFEQGSLFHRMEKDPEDDSKTIKQVYYNYGFNPFQNKVGFRFVNDFSNSFTRELSSSYSSASDVKSSAPNTAKIGIENKTYGNTTFNDFKDFNKNSGMLAGSKHVEWFTNEEIEDNGRRLPTESDAQYLAKLANLHGFIPDFVSRPNDLMVSNLYGQDVPDNIGGFMVTNMTGMTYHYSLPVYNFEDVTEVTSDAQGVYKRKVRKTTPYAYSWLITSMTGPDYVDRPPLGIVDENDWGYWVIFEYGKWTDRYIWRTPSAGAEKDIVSNSSVYSAGKKELYYLNCIKTRSHTALFVKDIRKDGKGVSSQENGGFNVSKSGNLVNEFPAATLKLSRILLYSNRTLSNELQNRFTSTNGGPISSASELTKVGSSLYHTFQTASGNGTITAIAHDGKDILDENDLAQASGMDKSALRQIHFNYSYALCPGVPNSFDLNYQSDFSKVANSESGKLTLTSIQTNGLNDTKIIPPTTFNYALPNTVYNSKAVDVWGSYKSDYTVDDTQRKMTAQVTTPLSAASVHAWSLSQINTGIGASIEVKYESDKIKKSVLSKFGDLPIKSMVVSGYATNAVKVTLNTNQSLVDLAALQGNINLVFLAGYQKIPASTVPNDEVINIYDENGVVIHQVPDTYYDVTANILQKGTDYLILQSPVLFNIVNRSYNYFESNESDGPLYDKQFVSYGSLFYDKSSITSEYYGGGLRVASLAVSGDDITNYTLYTYSDGTTSFDPFEINVLGGYLTEGTGIEEEDKVKYRNKVYSYYTDIISSGNFLPSPGVVYGKVRVQDKIRHNKSNGTYQEFMGETINEFEFSVFNEGLMPRIATDVQTMSDGVDLYRNKIKDLRLQVGLLKKMSTYLASGYTPISVTENKYYHEIVIPNDYDNGLQTRFNGQGRIDQLYFERKGIGNDLATRDEKLVVTEIEEYPVLGIGQILTDNKRGLVIESKTHEFDFYTGNPTVVWKKDSYNTEILTKIIPAHTLDAYTDMSHRVRNPLNKHMLSQEAATYTYKVVSTNANPIKFSDYSLLGLLSAKASTWSTGIQVMSYNANGSVGIISQPGIWRQQAIYLWNGDDFQALNTDGSYPITGFTEYNFLNQQLNSNYWQKMAETKLVDIYSHVLESKDQNDRYVSIIRDPLNQYAMASINGARYNESAYNGCEYNPNTTNGISNYSFIGNVSNGSGSIIYDKERAHTGNYSLMLPVNQEGFIYTFKPEANKKYRASVWVYLPGTAEGAGNNSDFNNAQLLCRTKAGGILVGTPAIRSGEKKARSHYLLELIIDGAVVPKDINNNPLEIEIVCKNNNADRAIYFDDFRAQPLSSTMTSYVYDLERSQLNYILNGYNLYTRFEYDEMGHLLRTYKEVFKPLEMKVSEQRYNYGNNQ